METETETDTDGRKEEEVVSTRVTEEVDASSSSFSSCTAFGKRSDVLFLGVEEEGGPCLLSGPP